MNTKPEKFGWINELGGKSKFNFVTKQDAARAGINANHGKVPYIYVKSSTGRYIGTAEGINFNG
jgi:hypothetical protein